MLCVTLCVEVIVCWHACMDMLNMLDCTKVRELCVALCVEVNE